MENTIKIPIGVRVIAVLYYVGAAIAVIGILLTLFASSILHVSGFGLLLVIPLFISAIVSFLIGRALYAGKNWARILLIVLGCIYFIIELSALTKGVSVGIVLGTALNVLITGYLLFNKNVKVAFSKKDVSISEVTV